MEKNPYLEGIRLFNEGEYWHAHEQWEARWLVTGEPESTFYKGIMQAAAALVHWKRSDRRGLLRNWEKSRPKLVALRPTMTGLDWLALIADMDRFVLAGESAGAPPRLRLIAEEPGPSAPPPRNP